MDLTLVPYQQQKHQDQEDGLLSSQPHNTTSKKHNLIINPISTNYVNAVKYKECMKNHAASIGGHANDGCGEFMPRADHDNALTCAACGCHRNFHRREGSTTPPTTTTTPTASTVRQQHSLHFEHLMLSPRPPLQGVSKKNLMIASHDHDHHHHHHCDPYHDDNDDHDRRSETPERGEVNPLGSLKLKSKRFRTKFTQEQKDRMLEFADKIGWRINKNDDMALNQFCNEIGIKRNVLKVWMHNNKNAHRRRDHVQEQSTVAAAAAAVPPSVPPPQAVGV